MIYSIINGVSGAYLANKYAHYEKNPHIDFILKCYFQSTALTTALQTFKRMHLKSTGSSFKPPKILTWGIYLTPVIINGVSSFVKKKNKKANKANSFLEKNFIWISNSIVHLARTGICVISIALIYFGDIYYGGAIVFLIINDLAAKTFLIGRKINAITYTGSFYVANVLKFPSKSFVRKIESTIEIIHYIHSFFYKKQLIQGIRPPDSITLENCTFKNFEIDTSYTQIKITPPIVPKEVKCEDLISLYDREIKIAPFPTERDPKVIRKKLEKLVKKINNYGNQSILKMHFLALIDHLSTKKFKNNYFYKLSEIEVKSEYIYAESIYNIYLSLELKNEIALQSFVLKSLHTTRRDLILNFTENNFSPFISIFLPFFSLVVEANLNQFYPSFSRNDDCNAVTLLILKFNKKILELSDTLNINLTKIDPISEIENDKKDVLINWFTDEYKKLLINKGETDNLEDKAKNWVKKDCLNIDKKIKPKYLAYFLYRMRIYKLTSSPSH